MVQTVHLDQFRDAFLKSDTYKNNFSYEGLKALFEHLEQFENEMGELIEFDIVALSCEYSEYDSISECYDDYSPNENSKELSNDAMLEWLQDRTQVIEFDGGIIIRYF